jgi:shikimate dehydrogenase
MRQAEAAGSRAIGGLGMLVRQGAASFRYWTGVEPPVEVMREAAQKALGL